MSFDEFDEYYQLYLSKHQRPLNRLCHVLGNVATIAYAIGVCVSSMSLWWLLLTPLVVYPPAVLGHLLFEGSMPAFLSGNPLYAKLSDWRMIYDMAHGRLIKGGPSQR